METVTDFILGGSKKTADGDYSHEIKRCLLLGRKVMNNLWSILKNTDIFTLPTKVCPIKATVSPLVINGCKSWTVKKVERWTIDAFELWCWRRLLRVPWTARRSNPSIVKEISPECSLEGLMLKLKLQYLSHLMRRTDLLEKILMLERNARIERDTCTPMFIAALFIIARTWKQPRCPSADEWIRKLWYIYTMEYFSTIKKNTFESVVMSWMKLELITQSEVSQKEKHQYSILTHIYGI